MTTNQSGQQPPEQGAGSQQQQQQGTKKRAGSISRYATLGKTPERSSVETPRSRDVQGLENLDTQTSESPDVQELRRSSVETPKRERHTVYFPPELSTWLRVKAAQDRREISELVTEAVERYRIDLQ
jgi:hypothetical protein